MAKYVTVNQMTGDCGESFASYVITSRLQAIFRATSRRDTGVDGELELTAPYDREKLVATGTFLKVQIKSSTEKDFVNNTLSIQLDEEDKRYFTSEMNVPGVMLYADLHSAPHDLYWAEIIPLEIQRDGVVHVHRRNVVCANTHGEFSRLSKIHRRVAIQNALKVMAMECFESMRGWIDGANTADGLAYVVSDFDDDIKYIQRTYELALARGLRANEIHEFRNVFDDALAFQSLYVSGVDQINDVLRRKNFPSYADLLGD